jgi:Tfp pilus assembly protein PilV
MSKNSSARLNQQGMVSFTVVLIMMLVISLIVIGFSEVTRRNQREALDSQLSSQAFYAAESGVNVTASTISTYDSTNGFSTLKAKTSCANDYDPTKVNGVSATAPPALAAGVNYSCVLVNPTPKDIVRDVSVHGSAVTPVTAQGPLQTLKFEWHKQPGGTDTSCGVLNTDTWFPPQATWACGYGVVRVDLVAIPPVITEATLDANTVVLFLTPYGNHTGTLNIPNYATKSYVASGNGCTAAPATKCEVTVTLPGGDASYYTRMTSLYRDAPKTTVTGTLTAGGATARFSGSQAVLDVTGQAQDELRRIQVRVALTNNTSSDTIPLNALSSTTTICKRFSVLKSGTVDATNICVP